MTTKQMILFLYKMGFKKDSHNSPLIRIDKYGVVGSSTTFCIDEETNTCHIFNKIVDMTFNKDDVIWMSSYTNWYGTYLKIDLPRGEVIVWLEVTDEQTRYYQSLTRE